MPQSARDTSIVTYRAKRDFSATPEPKPSRRTGGKALRFVVQKQGVTFKDGVEVINTPAQNAA